jgi:hypothetical protein
MSVGRGKTGLETIPFHQVSFLLLAAASILAVATSLGCSEGGDQLIFVQGQTHVLEKPISDLYLAGLRRNGATPLAKSKIVATLDSGATVRLLKTEYFKDRAAYKIELPDGRRGYVFPGDSIRILGETATTKSGRTRAFGHSIYGEWVVVAIEQPGITALSTHEAKTWIGRAAFFSDSIVTFGSDRCASPTYSLDTIMAAQFTSGYRVYPSDLGLGDTVVSTVVGCPGRWTAPGSELLHRGSELVTPWDGTYFVLRRR